MAPWSGGTVIGLGRAASSGWTLTVDADRASLDPLGLTVQPQRLTAANLDTLVDLLATATPLGTAEQTTDARAIDDEICDALAALPTPQLTPPGERHDGRAGPPTMRIGVLGPITIEGLPHDVGTQLSSRSIELLVYLALRGGATGPELDEALWHGQRIDRQTRNSLVYRTRQRVGAEVLPVVGPDGIYRLAPSVACDWSEFQAFAHRGLAGGPEGVNDLQAALDLVRDRPLLGIRDRDYAWAEYDIQHMISTIADTAHLLSRLRSSAGEWSAALDTAAKGLRADTCSDVLTADAIEAASGLGNPDEVDRLAARLAAAVSDIDPEAVVVGSGARRDGS